MNVPFYYLRCHLLVLGVALLCAGVMGCGKKAMPVPPRQGKPPAVNDLAYHFKEGNVRLTWTIPADVVAGKYGQGKLVVLRSKTASKDVCAGCPQIFQRVTRKRPIGKVAESAEMEYKETLEHNFRYIYKVIFEMESGQISDDSNIVTFDF